jgi:hypothetical protein
MSWQEMQSAPHDGTTIIVRYPLQGNVKRIASYNTRHKFWESNGEPFWPVQQHCQWAAIPPDVATPSPANGAVGEMPEPVAYLKFWAAQSWGGSGNQDIDYGEGLATCEKEEVGDDKLPAFAVYTADQLRAAVLAERNACADIVDNADSPDCGGWNMNHIAERIRART